MIVPLEPLYESAGTINKTPRGSASHPVQSAPGGPCDGLDFEGFHIIPGVSENLSGFDVVVADLSIELLTDVRHFLHRQSVTEPDTVGVSIDAHGILAPDDAPVECGDLPAVQDIFVVGGRRRFQNLNRLGSHFAIRADLDVLGFLDPTDRVGTDDVLGIDDVTFPTVIGREGSDHASDGLDRFPMGLGDTGSDTVGTMVPLDSILAFAGGGKRVDGENVAGSDGEIDVVSGGVHTYIVTSLPTVSTYRGDVLGILYKKL